MTKYKLEVSEDGKTFVALGEFMGNIDRDTPVTNPIFAKGRFLRLTTTGKMNHDSMRLEAYAIGKRPCVVVA